MNRVILGNNLVELAKLPSESIDLIYIDPPFNTGKVQKRTFKDGSTTSYDDSFDDYMGFIRPRVEEAKRLLKPNGSFYFHINPTEGHYCKVLIDSIFGRDNFLNEIVWAYDYGARTKVRWPAKHDTIFYYVKDHNNYIFNVEDIDRIPYMAPGLCGPEKAEKGKLPTDTWWLTIVSPMGKEKLGYATQKPIKLLERIIRASSPKDGVVLDFFAGSGTTGDAARACGRSFILIDSSTQALDVMKKRFAGDPSVVFENCEEVQKEL